MAFAFVQTATNANSSTTSLVLTLSTPAAVNDLIVINMKFAADPVTISVTDNSAVPNTYAQAIVATGPGIWANQFYGVQKTGGATTITVSWPGVLATRMIADEFSGGATTNATVFDVATSNFGSSTSGSGTLSPAASGELISAGYLLTSGGTFTAGTGYTTSTTNTDGSAEYNLSGTTSETMPASWTNSANWVLVAGAYKPSSSPVVSTRRNTSRLATLRITSLNHL